MDSGLLLKAIIKLKFYCHLVGGCLMDNHATSPNFNTHRSSIGLHLWSVIRQYCKDGELQEPYQVPITFEQDGFHFNRRYSLVLSMSCAAVRA